ncbi:MAG: ATP-binding cassette domain-containing protein [Candidatus Tritonobacter lacicola]|nr:ATP-binding cassette domain-containing protein [Candidatus Tritonobacter lacicola]
MIRVENLVKRYGRTVGVDGISFHVKKGEILGFLGPNGAGKSTTMRILTCFMPADSGNATVAGHDVFRESLDVRRNVGYLPENAPLYPDMRVDEYLAYRAKLKGLRGRAVRRGLSNVIDKCGIGEARHRIAGQLSKGYRQRVALAEALLGSPKVLILDEPTIGLDPNQVRKVRELIKELGGEYTILLSTHILPEIEALCGRVIIINNGRIAALDTPAGLTSRMHGATAVMAEIKGDAPAVTEGLRRVKGVGDVTLEREDSFNLFRVTSRGNTDVREGIFNAAVSKGWAMRELRLEIVSLEDIFVHITTNEAAPEPGEDAR